MIDIVMKCVPQCPNSELSKVPGNVVDEFHDDHLWQGERVKFGPLVGGRLSTPNEP